MVGSLPPPLGGTTVLLKQLVDELAQRPDVELEVIDTAAGVQAKGLRKLAISAAIAGRAARRMRAADVVVFHASTPATMLFGPILWLLARVLRRPLVLREFGGSLDVEYAGMSRLARLLIRTAFRADRVLLETHQLLESFGRAIPRAHCEWYANSRPVAPVEASEAPAPPTRRFAFFGHVKPTKGVPEILEAAELLHGDVRIDVYGPFHDGMSEADFRGSERVRYRGVLPTDRVIPTLREYDALLLPTHHFGEGYPGIILEAYAAGRPVIASRWRAIPEIVEEGVTGLLVEPRNPEALAEAIQTLVDSPYQLDALSEGARKAAARFASGRWTEHFVTICREVGRRPAVAPAPAANLALQS
jgi:glycosyltransferase involved in cell wall biosynthesis